MEAPKSVKWASHLAVIQLILNIIIIGSTIFMFYFLDGFASNEFLAGMLEARDAKLAEAGITIADLKTSVFSLLSIPILASLASIATIAAVKRGVKQQSYIAILLLGLHILNGITNSSSNLLSIIILFTLLHKEEGRKYLDLSSGKSK